MTSAVAGRAAAAARPAASSGAATAARTTPPPAPAAAPARREAPPIPTPSVQRRPSRRPSRSRRRLWGRETPGQSIAGVIVGLLVWGWVILPLVRGGPDEVRATIRAKFTNKDEQGRWLP